jgi:hypothetical protein
MPINITITGDHITDIAAEVIQFANMIQSPGGEIPTTISGATAVTAQQLGQLVTSQVQNPESFSPDTEDQPETPSEKETVKKWPAKRQNQAVKDMIEARELNENFFKFMTKARVEEAKKGVEDALAKAEAEKLKVTAEKEQLVKEVEKSVVENKITIEMLHDVVNKLVRDDEGNPDPEKMDQVFAIVDEFDETAGRPKIANIEESRYNDLYDRLKQDFGS